MRFRMRIRLGYVYYVYVRRRIIIDSLSWAELSCAVLCCTCHTQMLAARACVSDLSLASLSFRFSPSNIVTIRCHFPLILKTTVRDRQPGVSRWGTMRRQKTLPKSQQNHRQLANVWIEFSNNLPSVSGKVSCNTKASLPFPARYCFRTQCPSRRCACAQGYTISVLLSIH